MQIDLISLTNFRSFGPKGHKLTLTPGITTLVGANGSGKTALMTALARLFGVTAAQRTVQRRDFHVAHDQQDLESGATLAIDVLFSFPELAGGKTGKPGAVPAFFRHMSASGKGQPLMTRMRLQAVWTEDGTPDGTIQEDVRWITTLDNSFDWDTCKSVAPIERASIQLIYVPAARTGSEPITNLLKGRLWKAAQWSPSLKTTVETASANIQKAFDKERPAGFIAERLERRWQQVHEADTDTKPLLRLIESTLPELVREAEFAFYPDEAGRVRALHDLSDGQRSLFHIALTAAILEIERDALAQKPKDAVFDHDKIRRTYLTILAIEEPENSLAPFFLARIIALARDIGRLGSAQVVISSHSASILSRIEPEEVRYFRLVPENRTTVVRRVSMPKDDADAQAYIRLAVKAYPELYFARFVVLAEGESERIVLPRFADSTGLALDPSFVPIVPLGGRYVAHFWRLLDTLNIPHATLLDLDLGRKHGGGAAIRRAVADLADIGNDLAKNSAVILGDVDLADLPNLADAALKDGLDSNAWLKALAEEGVFFSHPIDLDFAMLRAFPTAYRRPNPGGRGPRLDKAGLAEKKAVTLKTGGKPGLYDATYDLDFGWYPYLFLSTSKPERHIATLGRIDFADLAEAAPKEVKALIDHVRKALDRS